MTLASGLDPVFAADPLVLAAIASPTGLRVIGVIGTLALIAAWLLLANRNKWQTYVPPVLVALSGVLLLRIGLRYETFADTATFLLRANPAVHFFETELRWLEQVALGGAALAYNLVFWGVVFLGMRRLRRAGRRALLLGLAGFFLAGTVILGLWSMSLPDLRGSYFVLWHQVVRVSTAVCATFFVITTLALIVPFILDMLEGGRFIPFIAARHVRSGKSGFLTVISVLSIAGVAVSSFALCAVVSIMGGFGADLKRKILGNSAHIALDTEDVNGFGNWDFTLDEVRLVPGVVAATPMASGEAMASSSSNTAGLIVRGVDPDSIGQVIDLIDNIEIGKMEYLISPEKLLELPPDEEIGIGPGGLRYLSGPSSLEIETETAASLGDESTAGAGAGGGPSSDRPLTDPPSNQAGALGSEVAQKKVAQPEPEDDELLDSEISDVLRRPDVYPGLILGREVAKNLRVYVGDVVSLVAPMGDLGPMGVLPRTRQFRVAGVFYSGMYEYDSSHAYTLLPAAQEFLDLEGRITQIDVKVEDAEQVEAVRPRLEALGSEKGLRVRDWKERNKNLFSALKLEKIATFIILSLAIAVASFCIICTLLLMVTEKSKEIAIIKSMGASDATILKVFIGEGFIIGSIGTLFGVITGLTTCYGLERIGVRLDPDVYYVDRLPINVDPFEYFLVAVSALLITILATVYPALAASRLRPVDGIRYE